MDIIKPIQLKKGDTIGVFTPSSPSYSINPGLFENGIKNLEALGFKTKLGLLTKKKASQGYRSGTPQERAEEFMNLVEDEEVKALVSTIGGNNSNSMIPFLDFDLIRNKQKIICGYSDVTSLHLAILKYSRLKTLYGPGVMTWFGEFPNGISESVESFMQTVTNLNGWRTIKPFLKWSNHRRDWTNDDWKNVPRKWEDNRGWKVLRSGNTIGEILVANLNTLVTAAGTPYFPDLKDKILLIESMAAPFSMEERNLRQLQLMGVFSQIKGLVVGKPEFPDSEGATFSHNDLILEIVGNQDYPIITEFDCSHTVPMHSIGELTQVQIVSSGQYDVEFELTESFVE